MSEFEGGRIKTGDIGTLFRVNVGTALEDVALVELKVKKPSGTEVTWSAVIEDVDEGDIYHIIEDGDLDETGNWLLSAEITFEDGGFFQGRTAKFVVYEQFD